MLNKIVILFPSISLSLSLFYHPNQIYSLNVQHEMHGYTSATNATLRNSPATFDQPFAANSWNQLIFKLDSSFQSAHFRFSFWFICKYEYRVTLSPNELKINSKLGGKYVGQECGELCNPLLVRRKLLGKSCRDGCNVYIYFFYALQFFTSTFINSKRDKNS